MFVKELTTQMEMMEGFNASECCPLDQPTCSKSGAPEEELRINIVVSDVRYGLNLPAGGWINIVDWGDQWIDFNAFHKDGSEYKYQTFEISVVGY
ncbi:hypothetical protein [Parasitella parasitica]|uniref:Uncharacterized protein n=1 Tax=Parasitella parasitica TaxID=35722 RepID=A0A0B7MXE6_9FUNG|nr:hypothetical protein [Parasitella parasitica]